MFQIDISSKTFNNEKINTVNARELHEQLQVVTKFAEWIKNRIKKYGFIENQDFVTFSKNLEKLGRPQVDYFITIDMAKELCMVENNEQGRIARQYFIEKEKELRQLQLGHNSNTPATTSTNDLIGMLKNALVQLENNKEQLDRYNQIINAKDEQLEEQEKQLENQEKQLIEMSPKAKICNDFLNSDQQLNCTTVAKMLGTSVIKFNNWMRSKGYMFAKSTLPSAEMIEKGYMIVKNIPYYDFQSQENKFNKQTFITPKGFEFLQKKFKSLEHDDNDIHFVA
jgi:anti-repressor protein